MSGELTVEGRVADTAESAQGPQVVLRCTGVTFRYTRAKNVLDGVDLTLRKGDIYGLLGPNGAGKSSLVKVLLGLNKQSSGTVSWFGGGVTRATKRRIGYVPQDLALLYDLSAMDNVRFFGRLYGLSGRRLARRAQESLEFVGLWKERKANPGTFSGGMKRRLNIACGIVHDPDVVIMDEPTVGVDPQSRNRILESIEELKVAGTTVVYISHYMEEVEQLCTRVGVVDAGRVVAEGTIAELLSEHAPEAIVTLSIDGTGQLPQGVEESFDVVSRAPGTVSLAVPDGDLQVLARLAGDPGAGVSGLTYIPPNLEQVFFRLTRKTLRD